MAIVDMLLDPREPAIETRAGTIYGFMGSFVPLAFTAVCVRLYSRRRFAKIGADDVVVVIGFILYLGLMTATIYAIKYGLGRHIGDVPTETGVNMQKCGFTSQVLYPTSVGAVKLSILFFLLRTLPPVHSWKTPLRFFAAFVFIEESAFTIGLFLQCRPINFYWDKSVGGSCFNQPAFYYADAALNMATDICILSLPWIIFRDLNMSRRRKYELLAICSVGVFTLISSIVRLPYLHDLNISQDPTWSVVDVCIWSIAELGSAITLCSVPAIRPLIAEVFPHIAPPTTRGTEKTSKQSAHASNRFRRGSGNDSKVDNDQAEWLSYTALDDVDEGSQKRGVNSVVDSQEHILTPHGSSSKGGATHTMDIALANVSRR